MCEALNNTSLPFCPLLSIFLALCSHSRLPTHENNGLNFFNFSQMKPCLFGATHSMDMNVPKLHMLRTLGHVFSFPPANLPACRFTGGTWKWGGQSHAQLGAHSELSTESKSSDFLIHFQRTTNCQNKTEVI